MSSTKHRVHVLNDDTQGLNIGADWAIFKSPVPWFKLTLKGKHRRRSLQWVQEPCCVLWSASFFCDGAAPVDDLPDCLGPIDSLEIVRCHHKAHLFQTAFADNNILSGN